MDKESVSGVKSKRAAVKKGRSSRSKTKGCPDGDADDQPETPSSHRDIPGPLKGDCIGDRAMTRQGQPNGIMLPQESHGKDRLESGPNDEDIVDGFSIICFAGLQAIENAMKQHPKVYENKRLNMDQLVKDRTKVRGSPSLESKCISRKGKAPVKRRKECFSESVHNLTEPSDYLASGILENSLSAQVDNCEEIANSLTSNTKSDTAGHSTPVPGVQRVESWLCDTSSQQKQAASPHSGVKAVIPNNSKLDWPYSKEYDRHNEAPSASPRGTPVGNLLSYPGSPQALLRRGSAELSSDSKKSHEASGSSSANSRASSECANRTGSVLSRQTPTAAAAIASSRECELYGRAASGERAASASAPQISQAESSVSSFPLFNFLPTMLSIGANGLPFHPGMPPPASLFGATTPGLSFTPDLYHAMMVAANHDALQRAERSRRLLLENAASDKTIPFMRPDLLMPQMGQGLGHHIGSSVSPVMLPGTSLFERMSKMDPMSVYQRSVAGFSQAAGPLGISPFQTVSGGVTSSHQNSETSAKKGKWCAAHVRVAWEIYYMQKKCSEESKKSENSRTSESKIIPAPGVLGSNHQRSFSTSGLLKPQEINPAASYQPLSLVTKPGQLASSPDHALPSSNHGLLSYSIQHTSIASGGQPHSVVSLASSCAPAVTMSSRPNGRDESRKERDEWSSKQFQSKPAGLDASFAMSSDRSRQLDQPLVERVKHHDRHSQRRSRSRSPLKPSTSSLFSSDKERLLIKTEPNGEQKPRPDMLVHSSLGGQYSAFPGGMLAAAAAFNSSLSSWNTHELFHEFQQKDLERERLFMHMNNYGPYMAMLAERERLTKEMEKERTMHMEAQRRLVEQDMENRAKLSASLRSPITSINGFHSVGSIGVPPPLIPSALTKQTSPLVVPQTLNKQNGTASSTGTSSESEAHSR